MQSHRGRELTDTDVIEFKVGNIFSESVEAIVNPVNCVGVMGNGLALQFRTVWPENFRAYSADCARGEVRPGRMFVVEVSETSLPRYIINFPTKRHWRDRSRIEDIEAGLAALVDTIRCLGIASVAVPALGAGLGGLDWPDVRDRIERAMTPLLDVRVVVFEPLPVPVMGDG
ncbi:MAG: hypothetical protein KatS3mg082_1415 [Nitrospiraceae bacterium]|nr:MAG: hypothetical protein KatS3mg082_1415 [Nitrospiraceae bacterium]